MRPDCRQTPLARSYLDHDLAAVSNVDHGKSNAIAKFLATAVSDLNPDALILPDQAGHQKSLGPWFIPAYLIGLPGLKQ